MEKNIYRGFKDALYENYRSTHNAHLYGTITLESIRKNFSVWNYYYGTHLPSDMNASILDIGCGDGAFVYFLQQKGYKNIEGIDLSEEQVETGLQLGIKNLKVEDVNTFLMNQSDRFDLIIARDVIEHFTRQEAFELLLKISSALKPGGKFMMQVPNGQGIFHTSIYYGDYTHEVAYTTSSVRQLFLNTGFAESACFPTGPVAHTWKGTIRKILWTLKVLSHRFWKAVETGNPSGIFTSNLIAVGVKK